MYKKKKKKIQHYFLFSFQPIPDVKIVANLPSITMEEVAPVGVSENQLAAPKELLVSIAPLFFFFFFFFFHFCISTHLPLCSV